MAVDASHIPAYVAPTRLQIAKLLLGPDSMPRFASNEQAPSRRAVAKALFLPGYTEPAYAAPTAQAIAAICNAITARFTGEILVRRTSDTVLIYWTASWPPIRDSRRIAYGVRRQILERRYYGETEWTVLADRGSNPFSESVINQQLRAADGHFDQTKHTQAGGTEYRIRVELPWDSRIIAHERFDAEDPRITLGYTTPYTGEYEADYQGTPIYTRTSAVDYERQTDIIWRGEFVGGYIPLVYIGTSVGNYDDFIGVYTRASVRGGLTAYEGDFLGSYLGLYRDEWVAIAAYEAAFVNYDRAYVGIYAANAVEPQAEYMGLYPGRWVDVPRILRYRGDATPTPFEVVYEGEYSGVGRWPGDRPEPYLGLYTAEFEGINPDRGRFYSHRWAAGFTRFIERRVVFHETDHWPGVADYRAAWPGREPYLGSFINYKGVDAGYPAQYPRTRLVDYEGVYSERAVFGAAQYQGAPLYPGSGTRRYITIGTYDGFRHIGLYTGLAVFSGPTGFWIGGWAGERDFVGDYDAEYEGVYTGQLSEYTATYDRLFTHEYIRNARVWVREWQSIFSRGIRREGIYSGRRFYIHSRIGRYTQEAEGYLAAYIGQFDRVWIGRATGEGRDFSGEGIWQGEDAWVGRTYMGDFEQPEHDWIRHWRGGNYQGFWEGGLQFYSGSWPTVYRGIPVFRGSFVGTFLGDHLEEFHAVYEGAADYAAPNRGYVHRYVGFYMRYIHTRGINWQGIVTWDGYERSGLTFYSRRYQSEYDRTLFYIDAGGGAWVGTFRGQRTRGASYGAQYLGDHILDEFTHSYVGAYTGEVRYAGAFVEWVGEYDREWVGGTYTDYVTSIEVPATGFYPSLFIGSLYSPPAYVTHDYVNYLKRYRGYINPRGYSIYDGDYIGPPGGWATDYAGEGPLHYEGRWSTNRYLGPRYTRNAWVRHEPYRGYNGPYYSDADGQQFYESTYNGPDRLRWRHGVPFNNGYIVDEE